MNLHSFARGTPANRPPSILSESDMMRAVPAIFAEAAAPQVSARYAFIPTLQVLNILEGEGWVPVKAQACVVRSEAKAGFQKHMIRLRNLSTSLDMKVGDSFAELVLTNSHDGTSAYQLHAGLLRLVCSNGLVVSNATFERISIRHQGFQRDNVIEGAYRVVKALPQLTAGVEAMQAVQLTAGEQTAFAESALTLKYGETQADGSMKTVAPISPAQVLQARRYEEQGKADLWTTFNKVQENVIKGGLRGRNANGQRRSTRAVTSINEDMRLNKALWQLAETMKEIKGAGATVI